jgi:Cyclic nucleotide-binding domain
MGPLAALDRRITTARSAVGANPALRRLELASFLWSLGEYLSLVALLALAYSVGGTGAVAVLAILQAAPSVVLAPIVMRATSSLDRDALLRSVLAVRVAAMASAALLAAVAPVVVLALAAVDAVASTLLRPVRATLTPALAHTPEELVATNVTLGIGTSAAGLVGPAIAGVLLVVAGPAVAIGVAVAALGAALLVTLPVRAPRSGARPSLAPASAGSPPPAARTRTLDVGAATRRAVDALGEHPAARAVIGLVVAQRLVRGMLSVLVVALAIDGLALGDAGVGLLNAALGLGSLIGALLAATLVRRSGLAVPLAAALALWGAGLVAGGSIAQTTIVAAGLAMAGLGRSVVDVAWVSLLQRIVPAARRGALLGLLESLVTAALAVGSIAAAALVALAGPGPALLVAGAIPVVLAAVSWPLVRSLDGRSVLPERELALLRHVPLFRPLPLNALEELARSMVLHEVPAGTTVVEQGEPGQRYYLVERGRLEVVIDGVTTTTMGAGDGFGEIALLRDVPRTATVRTVDACVLATLDREPFLAAVTGSDEAAAAAERVITSRLA